MHVAVDAAGRDVATLRIDFPGAGRQVEAQRGDAPVTDADVAGEGVRGSDHAGVTDDGIEWLHVRLPEVAGPSR